MDVVLCNRSDVNTVIKDCRDEWIIALMIELGVPEETIELGFDESGSAREEYIYRMNELGIMIELYSNGEIDVYKMVWFTDEFGNEGWLQTDESQLVGQWKTPERILRVDGKDLYYEIHPNEWSIKNIKG